MLLGNQRLRERRYEDVSSEPSAEESESAIRGIRQDSASRAKREPTLLNVSARERPAREPTLVGVGMATPHAARPTSTEEGTVKNDRSTDETIPRLESTCEVTLGEMEVVAGRETAQAVESDGPACDAELTDDTQGERFRLEKSFASTTIAALCCALLAFFLLPSGHDAPVPPRASPLTEAPKPASTAGLHLQRDAAPGNERTATATEQEVTPEADISPISPPVEQVRPRARTPEERKELRRKRREARARREAFAKRDEAARREGVDKRRKPLPEGTLRPARSGGKS
jgi:hypothetical protein